jgi:hypothetical protein
MKRGWSVANRRSELPDLKVAGIVFLGRFIEPVEEWIDFYESEVDRKEAVNSAGAF